MGGAAGRQASRDNQASGFELNELMGPPRRTPKQPRRGRWAGLGLYPSSLRRYAGDQLSDPVVIPRMTPTRQTGACRSGQSGQTVNLLAYAFGGSNPSAPIHPRDDAQSASIGEIPDASGVIGPRFWRSDLAAGRPCGRWSMQTQRPLPAGA